MWNHLRIWVDWNHDGVCDPGETGPIEQYGIEEIPLGAIIADARDNAGNIHALQGAYMRHVTDRGKPVKAQFAIDSIDFQRAK